jgi:hypothetical protein
MGFGTPVSSLHVVVLHRYAAEWISPAIALGCSRWHYRCRSGPLREPRDDIRLEASGSEGPEGKRWRTSARGSAVRRLA